MRGGRTATRDGNRRRWRASGLLALACATACSSPASPPTASARDVSTPAKPAVPAPEAPPLPFAGRTIVDADALFAALGDTLPALAAAPAVREDWRRLGLRHALPEDDALYADLVRVRLAFEATRAGGLWGLEWRITDLEPRSDAVWAQWRTAKAIVDAPPPTTATAECDELSALFAVVAHGLGLSRRSRVGLLWPTANHTVAVWAFDAPGGREVRVVVPTSQIFLDDMQSLDTDAFAPWAQKRLYDYTRRDAAQARLPAPLARRFVVEARRSGGLSRGELQALRNRREYDQRRAASAGQEH